MTSKGCEDDLAKKIDNKIDSYSFQKMVGFYTSNQTEESQFLGNPELDIYLTNCRLRNGYPTDINIEIFDRKKTFNKGILKQKYKNSKDAVLVLYLNDYYADTEKFGGYVYSAFTIIDNNRFKSVYINPFINNNVLKKIGMGDERRGVRNVTCLNDIISSNIPKKVKKDALFFLGDLMAGEDFEGSRLRHCFFEPSLSLVRLILVKNAEDNMMEREYVNIFLGNTGYKKEYADKVILSKLGDPRKDIIGRYFVMLNSKTNLEDAEFMEYIEKYVLTSSSKNFVPKGKSIVNIKKIK